MSGAKDLDVTISTHAAPLNGAELIASFLSSGKEVSKNSRHLYIIDDDALVAEHIRRIASKGNYTVSSFQNVDQSLLPLGKDTLQPSLILLDYYIPGSNILENLTKLKELDLPILVISEDIRAQAIDEIIQEGASGYIQKSELSEAYLLRRVASTLQSAEKKHCDDAQSLTQLLVLCCHLLAVPDKARDVVLSMEKLSNSFDNHLFFRVLRQSADEICSTLLSSSKGCSQTRAVDTDQLFGDFSRILTQLRERVKRQEQAEKPL